MVGEKQHCECPDWEPCACAIMEREPHCMWCCRPLTSDQEKQWQEQRARMRQEWASEIPI